MKILLLAVVFLVGGCSIKGAEFEARLDRADIASETLKENPEFSYCFGLSYAEAREDLAVAWNQARSTTAHPRKDEQVGWLYIIQWSAEVGSEAENLYLEKHRKNFLKGKKVDGCIEKFSDPRHRKILARTD